MRTGHLSIHANVASISCSSTWCSWHAVLIYLNWTFLPTECRRCSPCTTKFKLWRAGGEVSGLFQHYVQVSFLSFFILWHEFPYNCEFSTFCVLLHCRPSIKEGLVPGILMWKRWKLNQPWYVVIWSLFAASPSWTCQFGDWLRCLHSVIFCQGCEYKLCLKGWADNLQ